MKRSDSEPNATSVVPQSTINESSQFEKQCEPDDPMELHAQGVTGDPTIMLDSLIEEFARMGWNASRIEELFHDPFYQAMYDLKSKLGVSTIRSRIESVLCRHGVIRVREQHALVDGRYHNDGDSE